MLAEKIKDDKFLDETIEILKAENPSADIQLLEKTIGALYLVERLSESGLDFVFKGGTSLVLLLNEIKRFSVDVDIITTENPNKVENILQEVIENQSVFTKFEKHERDNAVSKRMTIEHYKFYFNSVTDQSEKYILLDVAYESNEYPRIIKKKIENTKLKINSDFLVNVPSVESILGDKLTVLGTKTTGIHYNSGKELELIKQLYDVDKLFNEAEDINEIRTSFINLSNREIRYRKLVEITYEDVLSDIDDFCIDIIYQKNKEHLDNITIGTRKFSNFMLEKKFLIDKEALIAACKVKYLIKCIQEKIDIEKYNNTQEELIDLTTVPLEYRKRIKTIQKINPEAYYYLTKTM